MEISHDYSRPRFCDILTTVELYDIPLPILKKVTPEANLDKRTCIYMQYIYFHRRGFDQSFNKHLKT